MILNCFSSPKITLLIASDVNLKFLIFISRLLPSTYLWLFMVQLLKIWISGRYLLIFGFYSIIIMWLTDYSYYCLLNLQEETDPYAIPMAMGIYKQLTSPLDITTSTIIRRIVSNHEAYQVLPHCCSCQAKIFIIFIAYTCHSGALKYIVVLSKSFMNKIDQFGDTVVNYFGWFIP